MSLLETGANVVKALVPPKTNDLEDQQRWRWVVFVSLVSVAAGLVLHISLAAGVFPSVFSGYASRDEQQSVQRRLDVIATLNLEHEMRDKAALLCSEHDQGRRLSINDDIAKLQREYWEVNRQYYQIPSCEQL
jgi:hypothetical protein